MEKNPEEQPQKRKRKLIKTTLDTENRLSIMQAAFNHFDGFGINFRDKVLEACEWSRPTYYRKKRHGRLNKQEVANLNMAFTTVLREIFIIFKDLAKLMPPEDVVTWSKTAKLMGIDNKGEFQDLPKKFKNVIKEELNRKSSM